MLVVISLRILLIIDTLTTFFALNFIGGSAQFGVLLGLFLASILVDLAEIMPFNRIRFQIISLLLILDRLQIVKIFLILCNLLGQHQKAVIKIETHLLLLMVSQILVGCLIFVLLHHQELVHILTMLAIGVIGVMHLVLLLVRLAAALTFVMMVMVAVFVHFLGSGLRLGLLAGHNCLRITQLVLGNCWLGLLQLLWFELLG